MQMTQRDYKLQKTAINYLSMFFSLKKEKDELLAMFKKLDANGDGTLTPSELRTGFAAMVGDETAAQQINKIFKSIDLNESGSINFTGRRFFNKNSCWLTLTTRNYSQPIAFPCFSNSSIRMRTVTSVKKKSESSSR